MLSNRMFVVLLMYYKLRQRPPVKLEQLHKSCYSIGMTLNQANLTIVLLLPPMKLEIPHMIFTVWMGR
jgi:hypothetical protein